jgi:hypothetical protein
MSMWLNLAKVSPDLLVEIRSRPELLDRYVWLRQATGDDERDYLSGYEFTYGPAFALAATDVRSSRRPCARAKRSLVGWADA